MESRFPDLSENHRRAISTAALLLDEMLCEFEEYARGRERHSVLYGERNRLSSGQRKRLLREIEQAREILSEVTDVLELKGKEEDVRQKIWAAASSFWEVLVETEAKHLRRYGQMPPGLGDYLDPRMETLIQHLRKMSRIAGGG